MVEPIKQLINSSIRDNITVNEYRLNNGKHVTEILTKVGKDTNVKKIYKDALGYPEKIIDKVFGKLETYYPSQSCIIKRTSDGKEETLPLLALDKLTNI